MSPFIKSSLQPLRHLLHEWKMKYYLRIGEKDPKRLIQIWYRNVFKEDIDLENPKTFAEKLNWMKLYGHLEQWSSLVDKSTVREYVAAKGLGATLNEVYGVYNDVEDIPFETLPQEFVVKSTNGGGANNVAIIKDKTTCDIKRLKKTMKKWLEEKAGRLYVEPQYYSIKPRIIVEKLLKEGKEAKPLTDYKVFCFGGKANHLKACSDREFGGDVRFAVYDLDWNLQPEKTTEAYRIPHPVERPQCLKELIEYSEILSQGIPFVRVDWYVIDGKPVFSELTFTPGAGFMYNFPKDFQREMGDLFILPKTQ